MRFAALPLLLALAMAAAGCGLRKLRGAAGDRFAAGVVIYDEDITADFGEGMYAVPIHRLLEGRSGQIGEFQLGLDSLGP